MSIHASKHTDRFALPTMMAPALVSYVRVNGEVLQLVKIASYPIDYISIVLGFGTSESKAASSGAHVKLRQGRDVVLIAGIRQ